MKTFYSSLENNIFSGILVKKGKNTLSNKSYSTLLLDINFCTFLSLGFIKLEGVTSNTVEPETPDFDSMTYQELKDYAKKHNIKTKSEKKVDILEALKALN